MHTEQMCFYRSLRGEQRAIIEKYASLVDPEYRKDDPPVPPSTPPPSPPPSDNNDAQDIKNNGEQKEGFFKNAFGKLKDKLNHECNDEDKKKPKD